MNLLVCSADLPLTVLRLEVRSGHCTPSRQHYRPRLTATVGWRGDGLKKVMLNGCKQCMTAAQPARGSRLMAGKWQMS